MKSTDTYRHMESYHTYCHITHGIIGHILKHGIILKSYETHCHMTHEINWHILTHGIVSHKLPYDTYWHTTHGIRWHELYYARPKQSCMLPYWYIDFTKVFDLLFNTNIQNPVPEIEFSRIWSSAQDYAVLGLLLNLVGFFISTRPSWSWGNILVVPLPKGHLGGASPWIFWRDS